jgi:GntR family transcriptional regulator/MocR family aminotransferase
MRELILNLPRNDKPLYLRIADAVRDSIKRGSARAGEALPSTRELAKQLSVNRHTVRSAFDELISEGWILAEARSCYRVSEVLVDQFFQTKRIGNQYSSETNAKDFKWARSVSSQLPQDTAIQYDLRSGLSDLREFPIQEYRSHLQDSLNRYGTSFLGYGNPQGHPKLLRSLTQYLRRVRSITEKEILITHGSQEGIFLAAQLLVSPGDTVLVEELGYPPAFEAFRLAGGKLVPIQVDHQGVNVNQIEATILKNRPALIYLTPLHQYPTTVSLSLERRLHLYQLACRWNIPILEDDYDHEYHYQSQPLAPMASYDPAGLIIYTSSFSKILLPSIRLGFLAVSPRHLSRFVQLRKVVTRQSDFLVQDTVARWMDSGGFERHLRKMRRIYEYRRDHLIAELGVLKGCGISVAYEIPEGGMTVWLNIGQDSERVSEKAAKLGLAIDYEARFRVKKGKGTHIRLGFAKHTPSEMSTALQCLRKALLK